MGKRLVVSLICISSVAAALGALWLWSGVARTAPVQPAPVVVAVAEGESLRDLARRLEEQRLIRDATAFALLARWRGLDRRIRSGSYELPGGQTASEVLDALAFGRRRLSMVTIPEGLTVDEITRLVTAAGLADLEELRATARDPDFLASLGLPGDPPGLEGYLFPDTYAFRQGSTGREIFARMARRFVEVFSPELVRAAAEAGLTAHQAVTLASLIEEEAAVDAERPVISAVFHNRLRLGMPLQSDPTAVYGVEGHRGRIRRQDIERPTSHNTYLLPGLPPGPIANPGRASLEAAVRPARGVSALYFVARNDRTHEFSATIAEHRRAVGRYQRSTP